ncbi:hypothetical protein [uncultured Lactobacillus sp.]|uniref:hypothetical protein n=1 Tax=uncultured Lactobacillus sp. TaxID=153152 RepID=UPI00259B569B|nr:hypothetical protein [uncultured Lactobacillus sp.]
MTNDSRKISKHITISKEDFGLAQKLIKENKADNLSDLLHYLLNQEYENTQSQAIENLSSRMSDELRQINQRLINMSIEQSTMSEYISDYLYVELYHDNATHINHGTDTDGYRNAKKLAMERLKNNQKEMTHRKNHIESEENKANRIISRKKYSWED